MRSAAYPARLGVILGMTVLASLLGTRFTHMEGSEWAPADPARDSVLPLLALLPACGIVALIPTSTRGAAALSLLPAFSVLVMWWLFTFDDSSTAALVFLSGFWIGIPVAAAVVAGWRSATSIGTRRPASSGHPDTDARSD